MPISHFIISFIFVMVIVMGVFNRLFDQLALLLPNPEIAVYLDRFTEGIIYFLYIKYLLSKEPTPSNYIRSFSVGMLIVGILFWAALVCLYDNTLGLLLRDLVVINDPNYLRSIESMFQYPIPLFIRLCIIAPITEEFLTRGYLLNRLKEKYSTITAIVISSLFFAVLHFNFFNTLYSFLFGVLFALLYLKTKSLIPCIIVHFIHNLMGFISYYLHFDPMKNGFNGILFITGILSLLLVLLIIQCTPRTKQYNRDSAY